MGAFGLAVKGSGVRIPSAPLQTFWSRQGYPGSGNCKAWVRVHYRSTIEFGKHPIASRRCWFLACVARGLRHCARAHNAGSRVRPRPVGCPFERAFCAATRVQAVNARRRRVGRLLLACPHRGRVRQQVPMLSDPPPEHPCRPPRLFVQLCGEAAVAVADRPPVLLLTARWVAPKLTLPG